MTDVVGGTIAALVATDAIARRGGAVNLYLTGPVGAGFQALMVDGFQLEFGARLLEISYGAEESAGRPPSLAEYCPGPSGHRPHIRALRDFLQELLGSDLVEVDRPRMYINGAMAPDIYFTVNLSKVRDALTKSQASSIAGETLTLLTGTQSGAGVLGDPPETLWSVSLEEASIANHGATFHRVFIDSVCKKIQAAGSGVVLAALRRKLWMPLFHTKTVWEAVSGAQLGFIPNRPFHTIEGGGTAQLVSRLLARIESAGNVEVYRVQALTGVSTVRGRTHVEFDSGVSGAVSRRPIIGVSPEQLYAAAGVPYVPDRVTLSVCWVSVADTDILELPSMTFVVDSDLGVFRINSGSSHSGSRVISLELAHDVLPSNVDSVARQTLEAVGIVRPGSRIRVVHQVRVPAFTAPTAANLKSFQTASESFNGMGVNAEIIGGATAFGADSLNEQTIQGLRAAEMAE